MISFLLFISTIYWWTKRCKHKDVPDVYFSESQISNAQMIKDLRHRINDFRIEQGLKPCRYDFTLAKIAHERLLFLQGKELNHYGWKDFLGKRERYGEVLAKGFARKNGEIMKGWLSSKDHRRVLKWQGFNYLGIATDTDRVVVIFST